MTQFGDTQLDFFPAGVYTPEGESIHKFDLYAEVKKSYFGLEKLPDWILIRQLLKEKEEWQRREQAYRKKIEEQHSELYKLRNPKARAQYLERAALEVQRETMYSNIQKENKELKHDNERLYKENRYLINQLCIRSKI